jgi:hypothetical protein
LSKNTEKLENQHSCKTTIKTLFVFKKTSSKRIKIKRFFLFFAKIYKFLGKLIVRYFVTSKPIFFANILHKKLLQLRTNATKYIKELTSMTVVLQPGGWARNPAAS